MQAIGHANLSCSASVLRSHTRTGGCKISIEQNRRMVACALFKL